MKPTLEQHTKAIHALSSENGHVILETEVIDRVAQAIADERREGRLEAYEHVADNLTIGRFALPMKNIELGSKACLLARRIVYHLRERTIKHEDSQTGA